jgi:DNA-binding NarL/FixJ family response regulator
VLLDLLMPGMEAVLGELGRRYPEVPVILTGDEAHFDLLKSALKAGAADYLPSRSITMCCGRNATGRFCTDVLSEVRKSKVFKSQVYWWT